MVGEGGAQDLGLGSRVNLSCSEQEAFPFPLSPSRCQVVTDTLSGSTHTPVNLNPAQIHPEDSSVSMERCAVPTLLISTAALEEAVDHFIEVLRGSRSGLTAGLGLAVLP